MRGRTRAMLVGLVPAAGHATRLGDMPGSKEVLEVRGRPVIDHLLERLRAAGPAEIRVVTRPEKRDVIEHVTAAGAHVVLGHPEDVAASLRLGLEGLGEDDDVLIGFPDTLWSPLDGFVRLRAALGESADVALGLFRAGEPERSDVVALEADGRVARVDVKPSEPAGDLIWGCAAARARVLRGLVPGQEPGAFFSALAARRRVVGVHLSDDWTDIGTPEALRAVRD